MRTGPTSGSRPEADLVDVELVDVGHLVELDAAVLDGPERQDGAPTPARRRTRRRGLIGAVVAAVVVGGVIGANVAETRAAQARLADLAGQPGVLDSLAEPLTVRWEVDGWLTGEADGVGLVQGGRQGRAVDLLTGEVLWTRPAEPETCWPVGPADAVRFGCVPQAAFYGRGREAEPVVLRLLEPTTGAEVGSLDMDGVYVARDEVDGDVILATALDDGRLRVVRWSPSSGETLWEMTSRQPAFAEAPIDLRSWVLSGDVLTVATGAGQIAVQVETGEQVPPALAPGHAVHTVDLPDGATATWNYDEDDGEGTGAVHEADGTLRFRLPGPVLAPDIDDGSSPGLLVAADVAGGGLWGIDATTGEDRWSTPGLGGFPLLVRDGRMLIGAPTGVQSIDLDDGSEVWASGATSGYWHAAITDGELVLTLEAADGGPALVARRLSDGSEVWRAVVPSTTQGVVAVGTAGVLLHTDRGLVGYG